MRHPHISAKRSAKRNNHILRKYRRGGWLRLTDEEMQAMIDFICNWDIRRKFGPPFTPTMYPFNTPCKGHEMTPEIRSLIITQPVDYADTPGPERQIVLSDNASYKGRHIKYPL